MSVNNQRAVVSPSSGVAVLLLLLALCLSPVNVRASSFEVTPILGYTFGGSFENITTGNELSLVEGQSLGVILGLKSPTGGTYEFLYSRQETGLKSDGSAFAGDPRFDVTVDYYHLGGTYSYGLPYIAGGLGVTHLSPEQGEGETKFSLSVGGGIKIPLSEHIGLRLEGRGFGTLFDGNSAIFCVNNQCAVQIKGDMMWQFSAFSGVSINF